MKNVQHILIIDDDQAVCLSLSLLLKRSGYSAAYVQRPAEVDAVLKRQTPDLVLLDMNFTIDTSGRQGLKLLQQLHAQLPELPVILMTAWATVSLAVEGMKLGARDFIAKPWDNKQLLKSIRTIISLQETDRPVSKRKTGFDHIVGQNAAFLHTIEQARRVSTTDASVLILGESGTGKEVLAEAIHTASQRSEKAFIKVNLGGISSSLFESELFGHKKGAFTDAVADRIGRFALADGGTIFLDEIGDLELSSQVKLLRVLQESTFEVLGSSESKQVDVRVISATNKPLGQMIDQGTFREDLYYRLNLICITLPPLRERADDIPLLAIHFLEQACSNYQREQARFSPAALRWLEGQAFPGNIRQLRNLVERALLLSTETELSQKSLQQHYHEKATTEAYRLPQVGSLSLDELEQEMIRKAMLHHRGNITHVARSLGITRSALYRRLQKYEIPYEA